MKLVYYTFLLFSMLIFTLPAQGSKIPDGTIVLETAAIMSKGLPGFATNYLDCLQGSYLGPSGAHIMVWISADTLVFSLRDWKESFRAGIKGFESVHDRNLWACTRVLGVQESLKDKGKWGYFIKLPEGLSGKEGELFIMGFVRRIDGLISGAKYYQDISFPAVITTTGK
ncbi:MAG: hypothetical protein JW875_06530 [Spirochaetales bacterium]|nr:hypothetical protein [Spirochaetales bacterium]